MMKKGWFILGWVSLGLLWLLANQQAFIYGRQVILTPFVDVLPYGLTVDYYEQQYHLRDPEGLYAVIYSGADFPTGTVPEGGQVLKKVVLQELYWDREALIAGLICGEDKLYLSIDQYDNEAYVPAYTIVPLEQAEALAHRFYLTTPPFWVRHWRWLGVLSFLLWVAIGFYSIFCLT